MEDANIAAEIGANGRSLSVVDSRSMATKSDHPAEWVLRQFALAAQMDEVVKVIQRLASFANHEAKEMRPRGVVT